MRARRPGRTWGGHPRSRTVGPLTRTDFVRYQGASGDFNPIHHDEEFARTSGFPSVFSQGMLQGGILASYVTDWLGAENVRRFRVQFREQVWPGDVLEVPGTVVLPLRGRRRTSVDLEMLCTRAAPEVSRDHGRDGRSSSRPDARPGPRRRSPIATIPSRSSGRLPEPGPREVRCGHGVRLLPHRPSRGRR